MEIKLKDHAQDWHMIREEVFIKEQGFQHEFDTIDDIAIHTVIYIDHQPAGCGRTYPDEHELGLWHLGRLAILPAYRKQGLGASLIQALEQAASKQGAKQMLLSAQDHAIAFYQKNGYQPLGEFYMDEHVPHQDMKKSL